MYAQHQIGVILPVRGSNPALWHRIHALPAWIDRIYVIGDAQEPPSPIASPPSDALLSLRFLSADSSSPLAPVATALTDALSQHLDVIVLLPENDGKDPSLLSHVIDPIVWGKADYIRGEWVVDDPSAAPVCFSVSTVPAADLSSPLDALLQGGYTAFSRTVALRFANLLSHGGRRVIAVLPCYNEELAIGSVVIATRQHADRVIVVDDGSTDRTSLIARTAGAEVVRFPENRGKAHALLHGLGEARQHDPAAVVLLDGDGQHNPDEIPALLAPILSGHADLVIGSRFLQGTPRVPAYRRFGQRTLDAATNATSTYPTTDSQSGFRALSDRALAHMNFPSEDYNIESDMITHLADAGLSITEVPITSTYAVASGHKSHPLSHGLDVLSHIIGLIGYRRPLLSFGIPGTFLTILGLASGIFTFSTYFAEGSFHYIVFTIGLVGIILGLLLVSSGLILNSLAIIVKAQKGEFRDRP